MRRGSDGDVPGWVQSFRAAARLSRRSQRMSKRGRKASKLSRKESFRKDPGSLRKSSLALLSQEQSFIRDVFRPRDGVLDLGGQELGDAVAVAVASSWPQLEGLQRLHLGGNDITDDGARGWISWEGGTYVEVMRSAHLCSCATQLSSCFAGVAALTAAIQAHHPSRPYKLRRLNLRGNNLGPASVQAVTRVCDAMSACAKLSALSAVALVLRTSICE
eukprot:Skav214232  [mRNA]  locus=scaffold1133:82819:84728:+ [translate_table: standard]